MQKRGIGDDICNNQYIILHIGSSIIIFSTFNQRVILKEEVRRKWETENPLICMTVQRTEQRKERRVVKRYNNDVIINFPFVYLPICISEEKIIPWLEIK